MRTVSPGSNTTAMLNDSCCVVAKMPPMEGDCNNLQQSKRMQMESERLLQSLAMRGKQEQERLIK